MATLYKALPGRENAKDWLTLKIVENLSVPMDDRVAARLADYGTAYNIVCQWSREDGHPFSMEDAKEWARHMENSDGTKGPHWTYEQAEQIMRQCGVEADPIQFWITICMMYGDYSKAAQKHGVGNSVEFYADLAQAFLEDKDAPKDKVGRYYRYIVEA